MTVHPLTEEQARMTVATVEPDAPEELDATQALLDSDDVSDEELEELLIQEITIDGMCGVY